eukprot:4807885-Pyramimonas_sp.AAC.1
MPGLRLAVVLVEGRRIVPAGALAARAPLGLRLELTRVLQKHRNLSRALVPHFAEPWQVADVTFHVRHHQVATKSEARQDLDVAEPADVDIKMIDALALRLDYDVIAS